MSPFDTAKIDSAKLRDLTAEMAKAIADAKPDPWTSGSRPATKTRWSRPVSDLLPCGHPLTAAVTDPAGVLVCGVCSVDVTTPTTAPVTRARARAWWARPVGWVVVPRNVSAEGR